MTRKLTLNYGVRWEPVLPARLKEGNAYTFDYDKWRQGIKSTVYPDAPPGVFFADDPGAGPTGSTIDKKWLNLGPRVGLAWDVNGNGRTSVRASCGLAYDTAGIVSLLGGGTVTAPWGGTTQVNSPAGGFENPWRDFPGGNPFPNPSRDSGVPTPFSGYTYPGSFDLKTPTVQQWNLSIQTASSRRLPRLGQLYGKQDIEVVADPCAQRARLHPRRGRRQQKVLPQRPAGSLHRESRHGLLDDRQYEQSPAANAAESDDRRVLRRRRHTRSGRNIELSWPASFGSTPRGSWRQHRRKPHLVSLHRRQSKTERRRPVSVIPICTEPLPVDQGNCNSDRRHIFNMTAVADTPQFANPAARMLASGWRVSGIYRKSSAATCRSRAV